MKRAPRSSARRPLVTSKTPSSNDKSGLENEKESKPRKSEVKRQKMCDCGENAQKNTTDSLDNVAENIEMNPIISSGNILVWKFKNVEELVDKGMSSDKFTFKNIDWKIEIRRFAEKGVKWLSIFLHYDSENKEEKNWICETDVTYKLVNQKNRGENLTKVNTDLYTNFTVGCGHSKYIDWSKMCSNSHYYPQSTFLYLKNDSIIVEVDLSFKYYDFSKNIPNFTDITINVEDTDFYLNKAVLCLHSKYFFNLFVNQNSQEKSIKIEDVDVKDFRYFIASFYPLFQPTYLENLQQLLRLAAKYGVATLHANCERILMSNTELELVEKLKYADQYNYHGLMKSCLATLEYPEEIKELRKSVEFNSFKESTKLAIMLRILDFF